jgi:putative Holliday junction resolvase
MELIIAVDYGLKRIGLAYAESPLFIAHPLATIRNNELFSYLNEKNNSKTIKKIVIGEPKSLNGKSTDITHLVHQLKKKLENNFPKINIVLYDERFTSKIAVQSMVMGGVNKKERRKKENIDEISAVIILQDYLTKNKDL